MTVFPHAHMCVKVRAWVGGCVAGYARECARVGECARLSTFVTRAFFLSNPRNPVRECARAPA